MGLGPREKCRHRGKKPGLPAPRADLPGSAGAAGGALRSGVAVTLARAVLATWLILPVAYACLKD